MSQFFLLSLSVWVLIWIKKKTMILPRERDMNHGQLYEACVAKRCRTYEEFWLNGERSFENPRKSLLDEKIAPEQFFDRAVLGSPFAKAKLSPLLHKELTFKLKSCALVCPVIIVFEAVCHAEFNCIIIKIFRFSLPWAITLGIDGLFFETFCLVRNLSSRAVFSKTNFAYSQVV